MTEIKGYLRKDGNKGIRNILVVAYLVECAHHVAREICLPFRNDSVHLIGFGGCAPNEYAETLMKAICTHPNVAGTLIVSLGCENFSKDELYSVIENSGRAGHVVTIQEMGGTECSISEGQSWLKATLPSLQGTSRVSFGINELVVGTICGGSDATSGLTANPAIGWVCDKLVSLGSTCIFEESGELIGCENTLAKRASTETLASDLVKAIGKADRFYKKLGHDSFSAGNATGGLTTIAEKSLGAYCKSGHSMVSDIIVPGQRPPKGGLYFMDVIPEGEPLFGFPNINDNAEIIELVSCGAHIVLFSTGRGSVVGSAISPVIKICANPVTFLKMQNDMDINAGRILSGNVSIDDVGDEIYQYLLRVVNGTPTVSERLKHQEFVLTYKPAFNSVRTTCQR